METLRLREAIREYQHRTRIEVRFYQAGSSEMFGKVQQIPKKSHFILVVPTHVPKFTLISKR
ncbi:MAG: GDP-mannose 4,6-dehydratase [cyanobacterium endosymbiont of Rhopalodia fuxianensis]